MLDIQLLEDARECSAKLFLGIGHLGYIERRQFPNIPSLNINVLPEHAIFNVLQGVVFSATDGFWGIS